MTGANGRRAWVWACALIVAALGTAGSAQAQTDNTSTGAGALLSDTTGSYNTATGVSALRLNRSGSDNTATGRGALFTNTASDNTATGMSALYRNTTGMCNTAEGSEAMENGTTANYNTALGWQAMFSGQTASYNTAVGASALAANTGGEYNVAVGFGTLFNSTSGRENTAVGGANVLASNGTGSYNTGVGTNALANSSSGSHNTAVGDRALNRNATGDSNTAVGAGAGPATGGLSNTSSFGSGALATASNTIQIGDSTVTSIGGYQAWSNLSDARFKRDVAEDVPGLSFVTKLRPVTFRWDLAKLDAFDGVSRGGADPATLAARAAKQKKQYTGFLAQEVESAAKQCGFDFSAVIRPANQRSHYELSYAEFVVPLVKAVQEQQQQIDALRTAVRELQTSRGEALAESQHASMFGQLSPGAALALVALLLLLRQKARAA